MKKLLLIALVIVLGIVYLIFKESISIPSATKSNQDQISSSLPSTVSRDCSGIPTPEQTEGPYYKTGSPQTNNIAQGINGEKLTVTGFVFDKNCKPIANAWLDFWQADANGEYDNVGFKLRGYQFADQNGKYELHTIIPSDYESRPPHIHVKVRAGNGGILTSQLYFPEEDQNLTDSIFNQDLIMNVADGENGKVGSFNFILQ